MTEPEEFLTFDDLTKAYRMERNSRKLGDQRRDLYPAIRELLVRTTDEYQRQFLDRPFDVMTIGLGDRMRKIQDYSARVIDLRIEKILGMASRTSMGSDVAVERLLQEERETFDTAVQLARAQRDRIDVRGMLKSTSRKPIEEPLEEPIEEPLEEPIEEPIVPESEPTYELQPVEASVPSPEPMPVEIPPPEPVIAEVSQPELVEEVRPEPVQDVLEPVQEPQEGIVEADGVEAQDIIVRMLQDAPPFAGTHRDYRLRKEDVVTLPRIIGQALIQRNIAKEIHV